MKMAKIGLPKGSGKRLKVREKSVKSQRILKWILSGNPVEEHQNSNDHQTAMIAPVIEKDIKMLKRMPIQSP